MTNSECVFFHIKDAREIFKQTITIKQNTSSDFFWGESELWVGKESKT